MYFNLFKNKYFCKLFIKLMFNFMFLQFRIFVIFLRIQFLLCYKYENNYSRDIYSKMIKGGCFLEYFCYFLLFEVNKYIYGLEKCLELNRD